MADNDYDKKDMVEMLSRIEAGPLRIAAYRVRDPETLEWGEVEFHMTCNNYILAKMSKEAAKLFSSFVTDITGDCEDE